MNLKRECKMFSLRGKTRKHLLLVLSLLLCFLIAFTSCNGSIGDPSNPSNPSNPDDPDIPLPPETTTYTVTFSVAVPEEFSEYNFEIKGLSSNEQVIEEGKTIQVPDVILENNEGFFVLLSEWVNAEGLALDAPVYENRTYEARWHGITRISNTEELLAWLNSEDFYSSVLLDTNLDMDGISWTSKEEFHGCFDGNGYTISNLSTESESGLFKYVSSTAVIRDLNLANISYTLAETAEVGGLAARSAGLIENCTVSGRIKSNGTTGGLVGIVEGGIIERVESSVEIICVIDQTVGGIFGSALQDEDVESFGYIADSESSAKITTATLNEISYLIGGVGGSVSGSFEIRNCEFYGEFQVLDNSSAAGILGQNDGGNIMNCTNNGTFNSISNYSTDVHISGIVGENLSGTVSNCINEVALSCTSGDVSGIAFINNGTVTESENNGKITVNSGAGAGIVYQNIGGIISNSVNNADFECGGAGGIVYSSRDGKILFCSNLADDMECFGSNGGIANTAFNTLLIGCSNQAYVHSIVNTVGDRGCGIVGNGGDNTIIACSNTGEVYNYRYTFGITDDSSDVLVSCYNSGIASAQNINNPYVASITYSDDGQIHTCVSGVAGDMVYSGNTDNVEIIFWNGITKEEAVVYLNDGIDAWNVDCDPEFYCDFHYELSGNELVVESGSPSGGSSDNPEDPEDRGPEFVFDALQNGLTGLVTQVKNSAMGLAEMPVGVTVDGNVLGADPFTIIMEGAVYEDDAVSIIFYGTYDYEFNQDNFSITEAVDLTEGTTLDGVPHTASWRTQGSSSGSTTTDVVIDGSPLELM